MAAETIKYAGIKLTIDGGSEFSRTMQQINRDLKESSAELQKVTAEFGKNSKSIEVLTAKQKDYQNKIAANKTEQKSLADIIAKTSAAYGETSPQVQELSTKLLQSEAAGKRLEKSLKETTTELEKQKSGWTQFSKALEDSSKKVINAGDKISGFGQKLTSTVTAPIAAIGAASFKMASDMEESTNKVNVAFGDSAQRVKDFADTSLEEFGIAKSSALDMASLFGDMGTSMKIPQEEAAKMSESLVGLAGDLASFKNIGIDQAQNALKGIFTGETESLKTLGIIMNQTSLDAFALANGIEKTVKEMSTAEQVQLRYSYVMDATKNAQGDFARTSDGAANQMKIVVESSKELAASFGELLLPVITPLIESGNELIGTLAELDDDTKKQIISMAGIAAAAGPVVTVTGKVTEGFGNVLKVAGDLSKKLGESGGITGVVKSAMGAFSGFQSAIGPVGWAIEGVTAVVGIGTAAWLAHKAAEEEARQEIINSGETLENLAEKIEDVNEKQDSINELSERYNALKTSMDDGTLSAEEMSEAESELAEIKQNLAEMTGGVITESQAERTEFDQLISTVKDLTETERQRAINNLQVEMSKVNVNAIEREISSLEKNRAELIANEEEQTKLSIALNEALNAYNDLNYAKEQNLITNDEYNAGLDEIRATYESATGSNDLYASGIKNLDDKTKAAAKALQNTQEAIKKNGEELATANSSLETRIANEEAWNVLTGKSTKAIQYQSDFVVEIKKHEEDLAKKRMENAEEREKQIEDETKAFEEAEAKQTEIAEKRQDEDDALTLAMIKNANIIGLTLDEYKSKLDEQEQSIEDYAKVTTNAFKQVEQESVITIGQLTENLNENSRIVEEWSNNLATLARRGVDEGLLQQLRDAGPESATTVKGIVNASKTEIALLNEAFKDGAQVAVESMKTELGLPTSVNAGKDLIDNVAKSATDNDALSIAAKNQITTAHTSMAEEVNALDFKGVGVDMGQGVILGLQSTAQEIIKASKTMIEQGLQTMRETADEHSPSKETQQIAEYMGKGLEIGLRESAQDVITAAKDLSNSLLDAINLKSVDENINDLGEAITTALKEQYQQQEDALIEKLDNELTYIRESNDEKLAEYEREYNESLKYINEEEYAKVSSIQNQIDEIDALTEKEDEEQKEREYQLRLHEKELSLQTAEGAEERNRIQTEISDMISKHEREALLERRNDEKDSLKAQIDDIKTNYDDQRNLVKTNFEEQKKNIEAVNSEHEKAFTNEKDTIKKHYEELSKEENLKAEARKMMIEGDNDEIVNLLDSYNPKWAEAGQSFADGFFDAISSRKTDTSELVNEIMQTVKSAAENPDLRNAAEKQIHDTYDAMKNAEESSDFEGIGENIGRGVKKGLESTAGDIENAAYNIIKYSILQTTERTAEIKSPSRKMMRIGKLLDDGLILGLREGEKELRETAKNITDVVMGSFDFSTSDFSLPDISGIAETMKNFHPALDNLESHIDNYNASTQTREASAQASYLHDILISGNNFTIREDADIQRVAEEVVEIIDSRTFIAGRFTK